MEQNLGISAEHNHKYKNKIVYATIILLIIIAGVVGGILINNSLNKTVVEEEFIIDGPEINIDETASATQIADLESQKPSLETVPKTNYLGEEMPEEQLELDVKIYGCIDAKDLECLYAIIPEYQIFNQFNVANLYANIALLEQQTNKQEQAVANFNKAIEVLQTIQNPNDTVLIQIQNLTNMRDGDVEG